NLDNDAQLEIVVPYRNSSGRWFLDAFKPDGTRLPGFPYAGDAEINVSPTLYDLDDDGREEILFTCGNRVIALRGDGSVIWSTEVNRFNYIPDGGYMTVTNGFYWSNGGGFIPNLPATAVFSSQVSSPMVADSDSVVCFDKTKPHGLYGKGTLHKQFGKNQRLMSGSYELGVDVYTADIDGDGLAEVLVPTTQHDPLWQPSETILDDDGAILWRRWKQPVSFPLDQWQNNACMIPVNPDHDNHIDVLSFTHSGEIAFRYWNGVELVDRPGWPKNFYPYLPTPPV